MYSTYLISQIDLARGFIAQWCQFIGLTLEEWHFNQLQISLIFRTNQSNHSYLISQIDVTRGFIAQFIGLTLGWLPGLKCLRRNRVRSRLPPNLEIKDKHGKGGWGGEEEVEKGKKGECHGKKLIGGCSHIMSAGRGA